MLHNCRLQSQLYFLSCVLAPPYATTVPDHVTARRGDSMRVQCIAHGSHPISFQWTRVGGAAMASGAKITKEGALVISQLRVSDSGRYRCVATNNLGNSETFLMVTVTGETQHTNGTKTAVSFVIHC